MFQVFGCIFYISICLGSYWWQCKLDCLWWLRVFLKNETIWIVNMAPCEKPRVAVAWPLPPTYQLINRFERPYNALRLFGCQTTVEILVFPMGQNFWQYCKVNGISFLRAWKLIPFAVLVENFEFGCLVAIFVGSPFTGVFLAQEFQGGFFDDFLATAVIPSPLPRPSLCTRASWRIVASSRTASIHPRPSHRPCVQVRFACILPPATPSIA